MREIWVMRTEHVYGELGPRTTLETRLQPRDDKRASVEKIAWCEYQNGCSATLFFEELLPVPLADAAATQWSSHGTKLGACPTGITTGRGVVSIEIGCGE
jgi:hypothetical protein